MLQILCSSVRVKLLARAKLIFLGEQPDDFFFCGEPCHVYQAYLCGTLHVSGKPQYMLSWLWVHYNSYVMGTIDIVGTVYKY